MTNRPFVLIHSPLVGTFTWQPVAEYLQAQGHDVYVPELFDNTEDNRPFWQQEVNSIDLSVTDAVLVGHSGAGALLPAIGKKLGASGYIFVDAVLPFESATRLALLYSEDEAFAEEFEQILQAGGQFPNWRDEDLQAIIPDAEIRQQLVSDLRPRSLDFFSEHIEVPAGWDTKPCVYIQLSESYRSYVSEAERRDWLVFRRDTHHFEMLTNPAAIAQLLIQIKQQIADMSIK